MSDKKDKGYDASMLRFVGNLLAGDPSSWNGSKFGVDAGQYREARVELAVQTALLARKKLRKIQESEESK